MKKEVLVEHSTLLVRHACTFCLSRKRALTEPTWMLFMVAMSRGILSRSGMVPAMSVGGGKVIQRGAAQVSTPACILPLAE